MILIRQSDFYTQVNELLNLRLPIIQKQIKQTLSKINELKNLEIDCILKTHCWGQCTQWRIQIMFDDYEYGYDDQTLKPHSIGGFVMLEEVETKQMLHCKFGQFYNTFKLDEVAITDTEKLTYAEIKNQNVIDRSLEKLKTFLDLFHDNFIENISKINFEKLGKRTE